MRARWLRFGLMLGLALGVVGLALAAGMSRGDAPGAGAQGAVASPTLPLGDAPDLGGGAGVALATPTPTPAPAATPSTASTPEISDDSHLGRTTPTTAPVATAIRQTPETPETPATALPANPPTCTATTLGGTRTANAQLAADCDTLLAIESTLAGTDALNWAPTLALASWEGITVGGMPKRVTHFAIQGGKRASKLNGTLPTQLGNLTGLRRLDLNDHSLTGSIPTQLGKLTALTYIDLADNGLTGAVPTQLEKLTQLEYLWLWKTRLSGPLPTQLGSLTKLLVLSFNGASLSGEIPTQLGGLTKLTELALAGNSLSGGIPAELGSLTALARLELQYNRLTGSIPAELGSLTALTRLELQRNRLSGSIPAELGSLTALTRLNLAGNSLTGCVPEALRRAATNDLARLGLPYCLKLIALSDGTARELILEWTATAAGVTSWQYRLRGPYSNGIFPKAAGAWITIPGSDATTRAYRLRNLADHRAYMIQVRGQGIGSGAVSYVSDETYGATPEVGSDGIPFMDTAMTYKGGGRYRLGGTHYVVTIPATMRLIMGGGAIENGRIIGSIKEVSSGSWMIFDATTGEILERPSSGATGSSPGGGSETETSRLFDQLAASIQKVLRP